MNRSEPIIYFAGPAQHSLCSWFDGHHILENYENHLGETGENLERYRLTFSSMCLDLGAYWILMEERGRMGRGKGPIPVTEKQARKEAAIQFAVRHGAYYDFVTHYDDIEGGPDGNRRSWLQCRDAGIPNLMAVFHQGEPWSLLEEYCSAGQFVGLGMQRPFKNEASFLDGAFSRIPEGKWVHIFAGTNYLRWPATSADSTTWLSEVLALMKTSGQGRTALRFLTQPEMLDIVKKKYQREWRHDRFHGTFGVAAGRGDQIDIAEVLSKEEDYAA